MDINNLIEKLSDARNYSDCKNYWGLYAEFCAYICYTYANKDIIELYHKLKPFINKGISIAIDVTDRIIERLLKDPVHCSMIAADDIIRYIKKYLKLSSIEMSYRGIGEFPANLLSILVSKLEKMDEENCALKNEIQYMPCGLGYQEAKTEFEAIVRKN